MRAARVAAALGALALATLIGGRRASAHQASISYHEVIVGPDGRVAWTLRLSSRDLYVALGLDRERDASDEEIQAGAPRLAAYVLARLDVTAGGAPCPLAATGQRLLRQTMTFVEIRLLARCPLPLTTLGLGDHLLFDLDPRHTALLRVQAGDRTLSEEFSRASQQFSWELALAAGPEELGLVAFVGKGMEHIYSGADHIAFIVGLLLVAALRREPHGWGVRPAALAVPYVLRVVTAFTLAHSLTLILAALDVIALPARAVESAIAASIVFIAVENLVPREPRHRFALAFLFGLVHGMGFAAMLRPLLPASGVVVPLLAFNLGVELGQLTIVAPLLPLLLLGARAGARRYRRVVVVGGSLLVGAAGAVWLVERLTG